MTKKKFMAISVSQEETAQAQQVFEHYHQIADNLHTSKDQKQAETALAEINALSERAQIALLKALSKEQQVDAADVSLALNELSPLKSVRKEARRSLIQLESARVHPRWESPIDRTPAISAVQLPTNPPRFWKGLVTDTRGLGMVHLLLFWEQGDNYKEIRILGFLLEFGYNGVKDFFTMTHRKRDFEMILGEIKENLAEVELKHCSLAQGRRLLRDALAVHERRGTKPTQDYRFNLSLIKQLILEAPDLDEYIDLTEDADLDEESEESIDLHNLDPEAVVVNFVEYWVNEGYDIAYDLLSHNSPLREGLSKDEWIERRESWAAEAHPNDLEPCFMYERDLQKVSRLWIPNPLIALRPITHKEVETGWSLEMDKTPLSDTLPELPKATTIYEETGRHWFWSTYTLVQENGDWRIESMIDEGMNAQDISIEGLQSKIEELETRANQFAEKHGIRDINQIQGKNAQNYLTGLLRPIVQSSYYSDVLIQKLPPDRSVYEEAAARMATLGHYERCLTYLIPLTQRFSEERGPWLRRIAAIQELLGKEYLEEVEDEERAERCDELAEEALRESLTVENNLGAHISLAELLLHNDDLDEAEDHFLQAKELIANTDPEEEAHIELHLGEIAIERDQFEEALSHYQNATKLRPDSTYAWFETGKTHEALEHIEEAETSYKRVIELEPDKVEPYLRLKQLYTANDQPSKALAVLEQGVAANPDSVPTHLYMVGLYMERDDYRQAEIWLNKAERLDPEDLGVRSYRIMLNANKPKHTYDAKKLNKSLKQKKKRR